MGKIEIRQLRADEIECRVQSVKENGCSLLLYKDARCDMKILDEIFGITGWQRSHDVVNGNLFCTVEIWDSDKNIWIKKQDVGVESAAEAQKGQASDSFKRACFNIGIGRELYTAPFIWVSLSSDEISKNNNKISLNHKVKFFVKEIQYNENKEISSLVIVDQEGIERFPNNKKKNNQQPQNTEPNKSAQKKPAQVPGDAVVKTIQSIASIDELIDLCNNDYKVYRGNKLFNDTVNNRLKELGYEYTKV